MIALRGFSIVINVLINSMMRVWFSITEMYPNKLGKKLTYLVLFSVLQLFSYKWNVQYTH